MSAKERDSETGLDYFLARYHSSAQGRFTSVDPENAGAILSDPQSWNGYAFARSNPVVFSDPDGRRYLVCGTFGGGSCGFVSDVEFYLDRSDLKRHGLVFTGSGKFYEDGSILFNGEVQAYYSQVEIDDLSHRRLFAVAQRTKPIPAAIAQLALISGIGGGTGGILYFGITSASSGLLLWSATEGLIADSFFFNMSVSQINRLLISATQRELLKELFGSNLGGGLRGLEQAQAALRNFKLPQGITKEALEAYREAAQRAVLNGNDAAGVQAIRLKIIEKALKLLK